MTRGFLEPSLRAAASAGREAMAQRLLRRAVPKSAEGACQVVPELLAPMQRM